MLPELLRLARTRGLFSLFLKYISFLIFRILLRPRTNK